jgi:hypothetical protein
MLKMPREYPFPPVSKTPSLLEILNNKLLFLSLKTMVYILPLSKKNKMPSNTDLDKMN